MEFAVHTDLPPRWPDRTFLTSPTWMTLMGDRPPGRCHYFELTGDGVTVAATTGYLIDDPDCYESFNVYDLLWRDPPVFPDQPPRPTRPADRAAWFPTLAIVQPGYDGGVTGTAEPDRNDVERLLAEIVRWAPQAGAASVAVLYAGTPALVDALAGSTGWSRVHGTVRSLLDVPPGDFDRYLAGLKKSHRHQVRCDRRDLEGAGLRTEQRPVAEVGETEIQLRMNLIEKYGGYSCLEAERDRLHRLTALYPPDRLHLFHSRGREDRVVGFSLFIGYADELHSFWCGFDYGTEQSRCTYFDAMFYAPIRMAQERGVRFIDYGLGHELSKQLRGCRTVGRDVWVARLDGDLDWWIERAADRDRRAVTVDG